MAKGEKYVKGATHIVLARNDDGVATESVERDPDGVLWHVTEGAEPRAVTDKEVEELIAKSDESSADNG